LILDLFIYFFAADATVPLVMFSIEHIGKFRMILKSLTKAKVSQLITLRNIDFTVFNAGELFVERKAVKSSISKLLLGPQDRDRETIYTIFSGPGVGKSHFCYALALHLISVLKVPFLVFLISFNCDSLVTTDEVAYPEAAYSIRMLYS